MHIANRAAEYGGKIILDGDVSNYVWAPGERFPVAVRVLEDTVINAIESPDMGGMEYYTSAALTPDSPLILANISRIQLDSGAVQLIYGQG